MENSLLGQIKNPAILTHMPFYISAGVSHIDWGGDFYSDHQSNCASGINPSWIDAACPIYI